MTAKIRQFRMPAFFDKSRLLFDTQQAICAGEIGTLAMMYLAYIGVIGAAGILLWPAVAVHAALSILLVRALWKEKRPPAPGTSTTIRFREEHSTIGSQPMSIASAARTLGSFLYARQCVDFVNGSMFRPVPHSACRRSSD
jgi:hypothetical protein